MPPLVLILLLVECIHGTQVLLEDWRVQNSVKISATPQQISKFGFDDSSWYPAKVPQNGTVMAVLLQNNVYQNITQGINLLNVNSKQFTTPWWYRTEFSLENPSPLTTVTFKGINYKANVWLNGVLLADVNNTVGTFRYFTFDVTSYVTTQSNALALEIYKPYNEMEDIKNVTGLDLAITFVDWAPPPPDSNMGLWREVVLETSPSPIVIQYPLVTTRNITSDYSTALLGVMFELANYGNIAINGTVALRISELEGSCALPCVVAPGVSQFSVELEECEILKVVNPRLWWPAQMGTPNMYELSLQFTNVGGADLYSLNASFGIRMATSYLDQNNHRVYQINGKNILIRGAGWSPDLFQRTDPQRQETEMQYVLHLNLNTVRLEGKFESDTLFDIADRYGILMMPGICCCDSWQDWGRWDTEHYMIARESVRSQVKRLRIHPSVIVFMYSSDLLPPATVEKLYLSVFSDEMWPNALLASAQEFTSNITGPTGVKMSGPYSWVPPNYWLLDTHRVGGAFGFLTEGGPGESPLTWDSFVQTFTPENYWPINDEWNFHCGAWYGQFNNLDKFTTPLNSRYGLTHSAQDYIEKSQLAAYEGQRAMFEGYSRNKYTSTGVIQWMLNNAFTEMIWHLYDSYLVAGGGYYGSKKACEPVHIMYSYNDDSIWVINSVYAETTSFEAQVSVYNIDGTQLYNHSVSVPPLGADSALSIFTLPQISGLTSTYFLKLTLTDNNNAVVSDNFYWLSTTPDVLDFAKSTWYNTPCKKYADYTLLQKIPVVSVVSSFTLLEIGDNIVMTVSISNPNPTIAFFIYLRVIDESTGANILPIFWDDNYITLLPQEARQVNVTFSKYALGNAQPALIADWWNDGKSNE
jgi:exo-1,4-beta-D-glucosaminidase